MIIKIVKDGTWNEKIVLIECEFCNSQRESPYAKAVSKEALKNKHRCSLVLRR